MANPVERAQTTIRTAAKLLGVEPDELTEEQAKEVLQKMVMRNDDVRIRKAGEDMRNR